MKQALFTALALTLGVGVMKVASIPPFDPVADNGKAVTIRNGAVVLEALANIRGPTGGTGPRGSTGPTGADGAQGAQGITGNAGVNGSNGVNGNAGPAGPTGATGSTMIVNAASLVGVTGSAGVPVSIALGGGLEFTSTAVRRSALDGDVSAGAGSNSVEVVGLQSLPLPVSPVANGFLKYNSTATAWEEVGYGTTSNLVCQGNDSRLSDARAPTGAGGGDLGGTYPNPTVATYSAFDSYLFGGGYWGALAVTGASVTTGPIVNGVLVDDAYFTNLTISGAGSIALCGFRLFVSGTLDLTNAGPNAINNNGTAGGVGSGTGSVGTPTVQCNAPTGILGVVVYPPVGGSGGAGGVTTGVAGSNAVNISYYSQVAGARGGTGGTGHTVSDLAGGAAGFAPTGGVADYNILRCEPFLQNRQTPTPFFHTWITNGSGSGGGGGAAGSSGNGGAGGAGGNGGGTLSIYANTISVGASTSTQAIAARGGTGGAGSSRSTAGSGGGGGGGGGSGGLIYIAYKTASGSATCIDNSGGIGGAGGNATGGGSAVAGFGGQGGGGGKIIKVNCLTGAATVANGVSGSIDTPPSGSVGGVGGTGGTSTASFP